MKEIDIIVDYLLERGIPAKAGWGGFNPWKHPGAFMVKEAHFLIENGIVTGPQFPFGHPEHHKSIEVNLADPDSLDILAQKIKSLT